MAIYRVNLQTKVETLHLDWVEIGTNDSISIEVTNSVERNSIKVENLPNTYALDRMVNLPRTHNPNSPGSAKFQTKAPPSGSKPSTLTITNCAFYTAQLSTAKYMLIENPIPRSFPRDGYENIGDVLGGVIQSKNNDDATTIRCNSLDGKKMVLDGVVNEVPMGYDIIFTNNCVMKDSCVKEARDHNEKVGTDFFFYYHVLNEKNKPDRTFELVAEPPRHGGPGRGDTVAACNPVIEDPPL